MTSRRFITVRVSTAAGALRAAAGVIGAVIVGGLLVAPVAAQDPCRVVTTAEASAALGATATAGHAMSHMVDEETGARTTACVFEAGEMGVVIAIASFTSPAAVASTMTMLTQQEPEDEEDIRLTQAPGPGDPTLWGSSPAGAIWVVQKGSQMLTITLFGEIDRPARFREPLRQLADQALARL